MWILNALLVHILLLGSIFVIYFVSPVLKGLHPQQDVPLSPPADRLVLLVLDGLRAESFFRQNCSDIPYLRSILHKGIVGISRTHVPTESRPGHIALIAGMYEDPSAVTRGWKENPIDFDTVFNRSSRTYAWGAHDVLNIFSRLSGAEQRLFIDAYDKELDFSGRHKTFAFDDWVFEHVQVLLKRKGAELRRERKVVFFLHLLGLDTAGHVHKPGSELFLENLHHTDRGVYEIYQQFEEIFTDGRTAYVLTADHGMTNSGSHGAGDPLETDTPFFLWGAGIAPSSAIAAEGNFHVADDKALPLYDLEQAQLAPLMSSLLGLPPPMNNFGMLPVEFLNASVEYKAHSAHSNALQLLEQFEQLCDQHEDGVLAPLLRSFGRLNSKSGAAYSADIASFFVDGKFKAALTLSYKTMSITLEGIDYYQRYYQDALLLSTTLTFIGWLYYLLQLITQSVAVSRNIELRTKTAIRTLYGLAAASVTFILLQRVPWLTAIYLLSPLFVWRLALQHRHFALPKLNIALVIEVILLLCCVVILVFTFFERKLIGLAFVLFTLSSNWQYFARRSVSFYIWLVYAVALVAGPMLLPAAMGYANNYLHSLGILATMARPFAIKTREISSRQKLLAIIALSNSMLCAYQHSQQIGVYFVSQLLSWFYLGYVFVSICLYRAVDLKRRVEFIFFQLTTLYASLCTSYEALFILLLGSELLLVSSLHQHKTSHQKLGAQPGQLVQLRTSFRIAFSILLYTLLSFFGVGNIASISSFDPNVMRCYLTTFAPLTIMSLVLLKLLIPLILIIAIIFGITNAFTRLHERQIFICLLLICDLMSLSFLFFVRNQGSWLEIGSSISHFVIMQVCTLVLVLLTQFVKWALRLDGQQSKFVSN